MVKRKKLELTKESRENMIYEIKSYFSNERDEEIGDLAAGLMLEFIIEKIAPEFYNQGVYDSYAYLTDKCEDLMSIQI